MRRGIRCFTDSGKMKKARYVKVVNWVTKAWEFVKESVIVSDLRQANEKIQSKNDVSNDVNSDSSNSDCDDPMNDEELFKLFNSDSDTSNFDEFE